MARDFRNQNNRATVTQNHQRQRTVEGGTYQTKMYGNFVYGDPKWNDLKKGQSEFTPSGALYDDFGGWSRSNHGSFAVANSRAIETGTKFQTYDGRSATYYREPKRFGWYESGGYLLVDNKHPDQTVTETYSTSRMQALDKRSGDPDDQKVRDLQTKRDGRNKLRIQLSGDASAGRLQGGPNTDRKRNKLKIDVQGGGQAGLNIPR